MTACSFPKLQGRFNRPVGSVYPDYHNDCVIVLHPEHGHSVAFGELSSVCSPNADSISARATEAISLRRVRIAPNFSEVTSPWAIAFRRRCKS